MNKLIFIAFSLIMSIILRSQLRGSDTESYIKDYEQSDNLFSIYKFDFLYPTIASFAKWLKTSPEMFLMIVCFISVYLVSIGVNRIFETSINNKLATTFLTIATILTSISFYLFQINALRQSIAFSLFLYGFGIKIAIKNNNLKTFKYYFLSATAHFSSFPLLFTSLIVDYRSYFRVRKLIFITSVLLIFSLVYFGELYNLIVQIIEKLFNYQRESSSNISPSTKIFFTVISSIIFLIMRSFVIFSDTARYYFNFYLAYSFVILLFSWSFVTFSRLFLVIDFLSPITAIILILSTRLSKSLKICIISLILIVRLVALLNMDSFYSEMRIAL